jgi:PQQ enzyme repeat
MKQSFSILCLAVVIGAFPANAQVNVTQEHNHLSRDGLYIDSVFTPANAANLMRDLGFDGTISGNAYAQPLYVEGGPNGPMVIAVTESNNVYALDGNDGSIIWQRTSARQLRQDCHAATSTRLALVARPPLISLPDRSSSMR